jgi:hypothetical protein
VPIYVSRAAFFDYGDDLAPREFSHRRRKIDVLVFHYESEDASTGAAAKTMKCLPARAHHERRRFLLMKWTERLEVRSRTLQREIRANDVDDVVPGGDLFDCF